MLYHFENPVLLGEQVIKITRKQEYFQYTVLICPEDSPGEVEARLGEQNASLVN
jgi:hypothetical protein